MLLTFLALFPFLIFLWLLIIQRKSLWIASVWTLAVTLLIVGGWWRIEMGYVFNALIKALLIALDIAVIIIGAIFFLEVLQRTSVLNNVGIYLESFTKDYRVQVIVLAWLFENFIEGTAGFGTPAAVVAPILVSLGLSPLMAVVLSLLGNSTSSAFGAAGTPIRVGLAGLEAPGVAWYTASFNLLGFMVPIFMLWLLTAGKKDRKKQFFEGLPFAIWVGFLYVVGALIAVKLGQEFPAILGAVFGLVVVFVTGRRGWFVPKKVRRFAKVRRRRATMSLKKVIAPYAALIVLLIVGKFLLGSVVVDLFDGQSHTINFFNPGLAFIVAGLPVALLWLKKKSEIRSAMVVAVQRVTQPFLVIASMTAVVQLFIFSGENSSALPSAIDVMSNYFANGLLPFMAPWAGAFGSFLTGSATLSNVMFGNFLSLAAEAVGANVGVILALSLTGAAAGNMIALADMLAAETVVGMKNNEREILKIILPFCVFYVLLVGILGMLVVWGGGLF